MITREAFEPRTENTLVIVGTDFFLTVIGNTLSWECGNVIRLYHKERRLDNLTAMRCALVRTSSVRFSLLYLNLEEMQKTFSVLSGLGNTIAL